jgi:hypothetical protein
VITQQDKEALRNYARRRAITESMIESRKIDRIDYLIEARHSLARVATPVGCSVSRIRLQETGLSD